eukprot:Gb_15966 [translate_table: standard]
MNRLAVPAESLIQSYDNFLQRLASRNRRKHKSQQATAVALSGSVPFKCNENNYFENHTEPGIKEVENKRGGYSNEDSETNGNLFSSCQAERRNNVGVGENGNLLNKKDLMTGENALSNKETIIRQLGRGDDLMGSLASMMYSDDTISIRKSVDSAVFSGNEEVEDACHHGLVDPTINTKEVMADINHMFCEPLHIDKIMKKGPSQRNYNAKQAVEIFQILPDEDLECQASKQQTLVSKTMKEKDSSLSDVKDFKVFEDKKLHYSFPKDYLEKSHSSGDFAPPKDLQIFAGECLRGIQHKTSLQCDISKDEGPTSVPIEVFQNGWSIEEREPGISEGVKSEEQLCQGAYSTASSSSKFCSEETIIIHKFVDSAIVGDTEEVEDVHHHGLVEPTIITKEAMADINDMFGKPLHFDNLKLRNQSRRTETIKQPVESFQILADEDLEEQGSKQLRSLSNANDDDDSSIRSVRDLQVFVDASLIHKSSEKLPKATSEDFAHVQGLQTLADQSFKRSQQETSIECSIPVKDFQAGQGIEEREWNRWISSDELNIPLQLIEGSYPTASLPSKFCGEDTIIIRKFADSASVGDTQEVEDACHHGLVDPTINTREAMAAINDMFGKPLHFDKLKTRNRPPRTEIIKQPVDVFQIMADEDLEERGPMQLHHLSNTLEEHDNSVLFDKDFQVFVDENLSNESARQVPTNSYSSGDLAPTQGLQMLADEHFEGILQKTPIKCNTFKDLDLSSKPVEAIQNGPAIEERELNGKRCTIEGVQGQGNFIEGHCFADSLLSKFCSDDTVVIRKLVDSAITGDTEEVEDACHHGLVDPTINTKEAIADINDMFWKPLQFGNLKRSRPPRTETIKKPSESFHILADEDIENQGSQQQCLLSNTLGEHGSSLPFVDNFQIFVDENVHSQSTKEDLEKSHFSEDVKPIPALTNENFRDMEEKLPMLCNRSKDEGLSCVPVEGFQIFVDEQFQDQESKDQ